MTNSGLLGDSPQRAYSDKLLGFMRFAEREIRSIIADLGLQSGDHVLDAGCGAGLTTRWLRAAVEPNGLVIGIDLAKAHCITAEHYCPRNIVQANLRRPPFRELCFDLVFTMNTVNHLTNTVEGITVLADLLRPGGRLTAIQGHFLPEMLFAWDAVLERAVSDACHQYYRDKYQLDATATASARRLLGTLRDAGLADVRAATHVVERQQPLRTVDREYFEHVVFNGYWGTKIRPYLSPHHWEQLQHLCDPNSKEYVLDRSDFHHVQTLTVVTGTSTVS